MRSRKGGIIHRRQGGYVGPHVVAAICFAIGAFCLILLLLGGPNGAWR